MGELRNTLLRGVEGPFVWSSWSWSVAVAVVGVSGVSRWSAFVGLGGGGAVGLVPLSVDGER